MLQTLKAGDKATNGKHPETQPSKSTIEPLERSSAFLDVPMRMAVSGACNILVTQLSHGREFQFATFFIVGEVYNVKSEDVQLASFYGCEPVPSGEFNVLMFTPLYENQYAFAVPRSLEAEFFGLPTTGGFKNFRFSDLEQTISLLPPPTNNYVHFSEEYVFLHGKAIDYLVLSYANTQLGKHFSPVFHHHLC